MELPPLPPPPPPPHPAMESEELTPSVPVASGEVPPLLPPPDFDAAPELYSRGRIVRRPLPPRLGERIVRGCSALVGCRCSSFCGNGLQRGPRGDAAAGAAAAACGLSLGNQSSDKVPTSISSAAELPRWWCSSSRSALIARDIDDLGVSLASAASGERSPAAKADAGGPVWVWLGGTPPGRPTATESAGRLKAADANAAAGEIVRGGGAARAACSCSSCCLVGGRPLLERVEVDPSVSSLSSLPPPPRMFVRRWRFSARRGAQPLISEDRPRRRRALRLDGAAPGP